MKFKLVREAIMGGFKMSTTQKSDCVRNKILLDTLQVTKIPHYILSLSP